MNFFSALVYLTGILPIVRDMIQSKLNQFTEYSMVGASPLTEFVGFTSVETEALCREHGMDHLGYLAYDMDNEQCRIPNERCEY